GSNGGLLIAGKTIESLVKNLDTSASSAVLASSGITSVSKSLYTDIDALLTGVDSQGRFFSHDKLEGVAVLNDGATLVMSNDSDFGIDGVTNSADRKSTRLNSSHVAISYAVFCLKKKK